MKIYYLLYIELSVYHKYDNEVFNEHVLGSHLNSR